MTSRHIIDRFAEGRERGDAMVLVTVYDTLGSTYSKAGARMLIGAGGESQGLVSGGCLEGDLAARARQVLATDTAVTVTYDLRDEADELFGLGVGCNGLIRVLLQPLGPATGYEPMASIAEVLLGRETGALATVIEPGGGAARAGGAARSGPQARIGQPARVGDSVVLAAGEVRSFGLSAETAAGLAEGCRAAIAARTARLEAVEDSGEVLYAPLLPVPRVLILGAGLDAIPLVNLVAELGWRVTIADHRPAYLDRDGFARAEERIVVRPGALAADVELAAFDGIVVMSHHLLTDREYLRQLAPVEIPYLGLLGPPARRRRLLDDLGPAAGSLAVRLRGPVGIDIGADSAESIALSIAAEMQSVLATAV